VSSFRLANYMCGSMVCMMGGFDGSLFASGSATPQNPVPEPTIIALLGAGLAFFGFLAPVHYRDTDIRHLGRSMNVER
jgi:hypothetical protein